MRFRCLQGDIRMDQLTPSRQAESRLRSAFSAVDCVEFSVAAKEVGQGLEMHLHNLDGPGKGQAASLIISSIQ
jgi:hypothetical protein